jgi:hypothetical protein
MKKLIALSLLLLSTQANAGWLASEATIDMLASSISPQFNSPSNSPDRFSVKVTGGSIGICHGPWIVFEKSYFAGNPEAYQRAFSVALMAYTTGTKVKIHNLNSDSCNGATTIQIVK